MSVLRKKHEKGVLSGDGRMGVSWIPEGEKSGLTGRFSAKHKVAAADIRLMGFAHEGNYCDICRKLVIGTNIV